MKLHRFKAKMKCVLILFSGLFIKDFLISTLASVAGSYTETTNDPTQLNTIGQRLELSFYDAKIINIEYCNGRFTC